MRHPFQIPPWFSTGRIQAATKNAREKNRRDKISDDDDDDDDTRNSPQAAFDVSRLGLFAPHGASHAIDRDGDDCHSSSATTPTYDATSHRRDAITRESVRGAHRRDRIDGGATLLLVLVLLLLLHPGDALAATIAAGTRDEGRPKTERDRAVTGARSEETRTARYGREYC
ncbi:hypothetical protein DBV15_10525 [Temnothorax longispinosus]|uniref:Uncharacterized protein n=1 Tax=Temnothorax longispinosus TaxID=300112 RepID=A0A4S2KST6_9HYME|nr:hypothetical protein DBV15_10525 [Temnothorax longispinosus]